MRLHVIDKCTVRNGSSTQEDIFLRSCACLSQTDTLSETVPADRQASLSTHASSCCKRFHCNNCSSGQVDIFLHSCASLIQTDALLETVPADRQTSLFTHAPAWYRQMHCWKLFQQTGRHLSSLMRQPDTDRCTVGNCSSRQAEISLRSCACLPQTDACSGRTVPTDISLNLCCSLPYKYALLETVPPDSQTPTFHLCTMQPAAKINTVRHCSSRQTDISLHSCASLPQRYAL